MIKSNIDIPKAVTSDDAQGIAAGVEWCLQHMRDDLVLTIWTPSPADLADYPALVGLVKRHKDVVHAVGRGSGSPIRTGPVLAVRPSIEHLGKLMRSSERFRSLCVVAWNVDQIRPWVTFAKPDILGDTSLWETLTPELDPVVIAALEDITVRVNLANPVSASGYDKDDTVEPLLALHRAGYELPPDAIHGWALDNGWYGENPATLAKYARDISAGKRVRVGRSVLGPDYVTSLRDQLAEQSD